MELEILRTNGIPQSGVISIRTGSTRRQVQLSSLDGPLKFPHRLEATTTFKVDVLEMLGSARLAYSPGSDEYNLPLESMLEEGGDMEVALAIRRTPDPVGLGGAEVGTEGGAGGEPGDSNAFRHRKELAARDYLEEHGLVTFMQFLMQSLMKDKPLDPYGFLQRQVTMKRSQQQQREPVGNCSSAPATTGSLGCASGDLPLAQDVGLEALIKKLSPEESMASPDHLAELEREASVAGERLRGDNARLRETAEQLKSEYQKLLEESAVLEQRVAEAVLESAAAEPEVLPAASRAAAPTVQVPETPKAPASAVSVSESLQMAAYRDIARMQEEVAALARENAILVAEMLQTRNSIEAVRTEMVELNPDDPPT